MNKILETPFLIFFVLISPITYILSVSIIKKPNLANRKILKLLMLYLVFIIIMLIASTTAIVFGKNQLIIGPLFVICTVVFWFLQTFFINNNFSSDDL